jgi:hypothetical protein
MLAEVPLHGEHADPKRPFHGAYCSDAYSARRRASARPSATSRNPVNA